MLTECHTVSIPGYPQQGLRSLRRFVAVSRASRALCEPSATGSVMAAQREPNLRLRALLTEARWTGEGLARAVNTVGAESGRRLCYNRASVAHWLAGARPRHPVPLLIAEAFSRKLGRPVTVNAVGLAAPGMSMAGHTTWPDDDTAAALAELGSADADPARRETLRGSVYILAAPPPPPGRGNQPAPWVPAQRRGGEYEGATARPRAESAMAEAAARVARFFADADAAFGGGHGRAALAAYLASDIAPWLRTGSTSSPHRKLLAAAKDLTYLCGFMCFDDNMHGAAQRYYLTALRLAAEAGDPAAYGVVLQAMSVQAHYLGHHRYALDLAEEALRGAAGVAAPPTRAFLLGQRAVAHAGVGHHGAALSDLRAAERLLARTGGTSDVIGAYHQASLEHQRAEMLAALGDRPGAISALAASLRHRPPAERRSRAITLARLAELQLDHGHLEAAVQTWHRFLDEYPFLCCGRADTALAVMRARIRPHRNNAAARGLWRRAGRPADAITPPPPR